MIEERKKYSVWLSIFICYEILTFFLLILFPQTLDWSKLWFPLWARLFGAFLGFLALLWFLWVHRSLGNNFSVKLRIKTSHILVTDGPYRWIRHPMYTAFYILHAAVFFLTANWFIGLTWLTGLTLIVFIRIQREERMLLSNFGKIYGAYMQRTGRFLPRFRLKMLSRQK